MFSDLIILFETADRQVMAVIVGATLTLLFSALVLGATARSGYYRRICRAVSRTDRFIGRHLIIKEDNKAQFFSECMAHLPAEYRRSWRYYVDRKEGRAGDCFPPVQYLAEVVRYETGRSELIYLAIVAAALCGEILYFLYASVSPKICVGVLTAQTLIGILGGINHRLLRIRATTRLPKKMEELAQMLNRFVNLKPLSHTVEFRMQRQEDSPSSDQPLSTAS